MVKMKKLRNLLLMSLCMVGMVLTGCKGKDKGGEQTLDKDTVYQMTDFLSKDEVEGDIYDISVAGDKVYIYTGMWEDLTPPATNSDVEPEYLSKSTYNFYSCNTDGSDLKKFYTEESMSNESNMWLSRFLVSKTGDLYLMYNSYDENTGTSKDILKLMDANGNITKEITLSDIFEGNDSYINNLIINDEGGFYVFGDQNIYSVDGDGNKLFSVKTDNWIDSSCISATGDLIITSYGEKGIEIKKLDKESRQFGETISAPVSNYGNVRIIGGTGSDYSFYVNDGNDVYGYKEADGSYEKILNWLSSNTSGNYVNNIFAMENGEFLVNYNDYNNNTSNGIYLMKKVNPEDVVEKTIITYAGMYVSDTIRSKAVEFNKSQNEYQIVIKDYSSEEEPQTKFNADLLAGDIPDIIDLSNLSADTYIAKGMLEDLYTYIDRDENLDRADFQDNILKIMERDGKLYQIGTVYNIYALAIHKSDLKGSDSLTIDNLIALEKEKNARGFSNYTSCQSILYSFCSHNYDNYIDWSTGECSFDSDEFVKLLEYAMTYPKEDEIDWSGEYESMPSMIRGGKLLMAEIYSMDFQEVEVYDQMFDGDIAFIGYPTENGSGVAASISESFAISSSSKNKDGAWKFISQFLTKENYLKNRDMYWGIPVRKDCFEELLRRSTITEKYVDEYGKEVYPLDGGYGYDDFEVQIKPLNDEQVELVRQLVASVDHQYRYNEDIMKIITEETGALFDGQKSAKEVAGIIQNRVSTYVNENR